MKAYDMGIRRSLAGLVVHQLDLLLNALPAQALKRKGIDHAQHTDRAAPTS